MNDNQMVLDLQRQIRAIRFEASIERQQGKGYRADVMDDIVASFERILLKYTHPVPVVPGYPRSGGWRSSAYNLFPIFHKA